MQTDSHKLPRLIIHRKTHWLTNYGLQSGGVTCLEFTSRIWFDRKVSCLTYFYLTRFPTEKVSFKLDLKNRSRYSHTPAACGPSGPSLQFLTFSCTGSTS